MINSTNNVGHPPFLICLDDNTNEGGIIFNAPPWQAHSLQITEKYEKSSKICKNSLNMTGLSFHRHLGWIISPPKPIYLSGFPSQEPKSIRPL